MWYMEIKPVYAEKQSNNQLWIAQPKYRFPCVLNNGHYQRKSMPVLGDVNFDYLKR